MPSWPRSPGWTSWRARPPRSTTPQPRTYPVTCASRARCITSRSGQRARSPGAGVRLITFTIPIPNDAEPYEALSLYEWTGGGWRFVPSQVIREDERIEANLDYVPGPVAVFHQEPVVPAVAADLDASSDVAAMAESVAEVNPVGLYLQGDGSLAGGLPAGVADLGPEARVVPVVRNWGPDGVIRATGPTTSWPSPSSGRPHRGPAGSGGERLGGDRARYREVNQTANPVHRLRARSGPPVSTRWQSLGVRVSNPPDRR